MTYTLLALNIAHFVAMHLLHPDKMSLKSLLWGLDTPILIHFGAQQNLLVLMGEYYRLITCNFVHAGVFHLFFNCVALYYLGLVFEGIFGKWKFLIIYTLSGLASSIATLYYMDAHTISVGASGAIFGIAGAFISATIFRQKHTMGKFNLKLLSMFALIYAIDTLIGFAIPMINMSAHTGGFVAGLLLGYSLVHLEYEEGSDIIGSLMIGIVMLSMVAAGSYMYFIRQEKILQGIPYLLPDSPESIDHLEARLTESSAFREMDNETLCLYGEMMRLRDKTESAIKIQQQLLQRQPNDRCALAALFSIYLNSNAADLDLAEPYAAKLANLSPTDPALNTRLGFFAYRRGNAAKAIWYFKQVLAEEDSHIRIRLDRQIRKLKNRLFAPLLSKLEPPDDGLVIPMLESYLYLGEYQTALDLSQELPESIFIWEIVEKAYLGLGQPAKAEEYQRKIMTEYEKGIKKGEPNEALFNNFAWYLAQRRLKLDLALKYSQQAVSLDENSLVLLDTLAWVYHQQGNQAEALAIMEKILEKNPEGVYFYHRGMILVALERPVVALEDLHQALRKGVDLLDRLEIERAIALIPPPAPRPGGENDGAPAATRRK
jgi:rhomboid protease GluP